jgi:hypothetical protein
MHTPLSSSNSSNLYQGNPDRNQNLWNIGDKRDDSNFPIVNFPFICSNIPAAPAYEVYISQMIRYSRGFGSYQDFLD